MPYPFLRSAFLLLPLCLALSACVPSLPRKTSTPAYPRDEFASTDTYARAFPGSPAKTCEAARRALLSQGYVTAEGGREEIIARKKFQPEADSHVQIEFHIVCAPESRGSNSSTVFANAVRDRYALKKSSTSASLGVGGIGSVSLPFGGSEDSLVKVASETIPAKSFYEGFFNILERYLDLPEELVDGSGGKEASVPKEAAIEAVKAAAMEAAREAARTAAREAREAQEAARQVQPPPLPAQEGDRVSAAPAETATTRTP